MALICLVIPIIILLFEFNIVRRAVYWLGCDHKSLIGIIENTISSNCIKDKLATHSYIIIYTIIECLLFPSIIIYSRSNYLPAIICSTLLQTLEFIITARLRPFIA